MPYVLVLVLVKEIEISDTLPLMAFGCSLPYIEPRYVKVTWTCVIITPMGVL